MRERAQSKTDKAALHIGGRKFVPVTDTTLRHDLAIQRELHRAGLEGLQLGPGEDAKLFTQWLLRTACVQGDLPLLGCLLVPEGLERWTPQVAADTADFLGELKDEADKRLVQSQIASVLFSFTTAGLLSLTVSATSSLTEAAKQNRLNETTPSPSTDSGQR